MLEQIRDWQIERLPTEGIYQRTQGYWREWSEKGGLTLRTATGDPVGNRIDWSQTYLRVGEVEAMIRAHMPSKLPDWGAFGGAELYIRPPQSG